MDRRFWVLLPASLLMLNHPASVFSASRAEDLFQEAILAETGERDMDKAIRLYKKTLPEAKNDPALAAKAILHLGMCYERLGQIKEAMTCYRSLLQKTANAPSEIVKEARFNQQRLTVRLASALNSADTKKVIAGGPQAGAVRSDGTILWWGANPVTETSLQPIPLTGVVDALNLALGSWHLLVLNQDGTLLAWGANSDGQLGDGTTTDRPQPVAIAGLSAVNAIAAGEGHSLAVKSDGTVWAWGANSHGQLGDNSFTQRTKPVQVEGLSGGVAIAGGREHSVALTQDGSVWCWGSNSHGQLGMGSVLPLLAHPRRVPGIGTVMAIAAGADHTIALKGDGILWAWGDNAFGQLGNGTTVPADTPVPVEYLSDVQAVAAGPTYTMALMSDGTVWAWGDNAHGALGTGDTLPRRSPGRVANLNNVVSLAAGAWHNMAIKKDGTVWAWGRNDQGQLGDGSTRDRLTPIQISSNPPAPQ